MKGFAVRKMIYQGSLMVNICDEELRGMTVKEGSLEIRITKDYFHTIVDEVEVQRLLRECSIANLVGERTVNKALSMKMASSLSVRKISGIPFLMIFKFTHGY